MNQLTNPLCRLQHRFADGGLLELGENLELLTGLTGWTGSGACGAGPDGAADKRYS